MKAEVFLLLFFVTWASSLVPPKFQWKIMDFAWKDQSAKEQALASGDYVPKNNMPTGIARWKDKLFITIPRWKTGVPASLNYVLLNGTQHEPLQPYPSWEEAMVSSNATTISSEATIVSTFRIHVDSHDQLWVVDNGVVDMSMDVKQVTAPAIVVFDLFKDTVKHRIIIPPDLLHDSSVLTSVVVDNIDKNGDKAYVYITDMGSNAIIVYSMQDKEGWRVEHPHFKFDPLAGVYKVGGIDFYWNDGVSSATLSKPNKDGFRDLYLHPTSSNKLFKMSTKLLREKNVSQEELNKGVEIVGDRGPKSQATASDFDPKTNVLFYTQLSKNGVGCWNTDKPFVEANTPVIISDCNVMEFPNDIKVDHDSNLWILSNRQSRFLYESMDFDQVNFRIMTAHVETVIKGTACEKGRSKFSFSRKRSK